MEPALEEPERGTALWCCCSLTLYAPEGDAPVSSPLRLEGDVLCWIALKASQNVTVQGEIFMNVDDFASSSCTLWRPHAGSQREQLIIF